jgi:hypothetical protein
MKKILFLLLLVLVGCQNYEEPSNPQLNLNGEWIISSITPVYSPGLDNIKILNTDYFAQSPFYVVSTNGNDMVIENDTTNIRPCFFYKMGYVWEFDNDLLILQNDVGKILREYYIGFMDSFYDPNDFMLTDKQTGEQIPGTWHFSQNGNGAMPANDLIITVPQIYFSIEGSGRTYDRFISQECILTFTR